MQQTLYKNSSYLVFTSFYLLQTSALNRNLQRALDFLKAFLKKIQIHQKILKTLDLKIFSEEKPLRTLVLIKASKRKIHLLFITQIFVAKIYVFPQIRRKCDWYENHEKFNKFFLNFKKARASQIIILTPVKNDLSCDL